MSFIPRFGRSLIQDALDARDVNQQTAIADSPGAITYEPEGAIVLESRAAGQQGLSNFLNNDNNAAAPVGLSRTIQPGIDLRDYMRQFRFSNWSGAVAIADEVQQVAWTVPEGEFWDLKSMWYHNLDSGAHDVIIRSTFNNDASFPAQYVPVFTRVLADVQKTIYGNIWEGTQGSGDNGYFSGLLPTIMEPGDVLTFQDLDAYAVAVTAAGGIVYELVPEPAKRTVKGVGTSSLIIAP